MAVVFDCNKKKANKSSNFLFGPQMRFIFFIIRPRKINILRGGRCGHCDSIRRAEDQRTRNQDHLSLQDVGLCPADKERSETANCSTEEATECEEVWYTAPGRAFLEGPAGIKQDQDPMASEK